MQTKERIKRWLESIKINNNIFVADIDNMVVGYCIYGKEFLNTFDNCGEIYSICILEEFQSLNIGRQLAVAGMEELLKDGCTKMVTKCLKGIYSNSFHASIGGELIGKENKKRDIVIICI